MNNRTKMLLSAAAVILVVAVIAVMLLQSPTGGLSGATALVISPSSPVIMEGKTLDLTVNSTYRCNWFASNPAVSFVGDVKEVKTVTIRADIAGTVTIEARCGLVNVNKVTTEVTVNPLLAISPANPNIVVANSKAFYVEPMYTCNWSSSSDAVSITPPASGVAAVTVKANTADQSATITAECGADGTVSTNVTIKAFAFSPDYMNKFEGSTQTLSAPAGAIEPCTWNTSSANIQFQLPDGSRTTTAQTGLSVTLYYRSNWARITISCAQGQTANFGAKACPAGDNDCIGRRPPVVYTPGQVIAFFAKIGPAGDAAGLFRGPFQ